MNSDCRKLLVVGSALAGESAHAHLFCQEERHPFFSPSSQELWTKLALSAILAKVSSPNYPMTPQENVPIEIKPIGVDVEVDHQPIFLKLWDFSVRPDYMRTRLRPLTYIDAHVILLCFSIVDPAALESVADLWLPEILHYTSPNPPPILLVGCKKDQRNDEYRRQAGERSIKYEEAAALAQSLQIHSYLECSAVTGEGVREVFLHATEAARYYEIPKLSRRRAGCVIV